MLPADKIMAPTDFSKASRFAIRQASQLAEHFGAELVVAHVIEPVSVPPDLDYGVDSPIYEPGLYRECEERLQDLVRSQMPEKIPVRTVLCYGDAPREICRIARDEGVDLIVLSTHGLTGWRHLVFGSVAEKVVRLAGCPVLTLRAPQDGD